MRRLLPIALLALLGFALAGGSANAGNVGPFVPDPVAEADACSKVVADPPKSWAGIDQGDIGDVDWLALVAFHFAYGSWPDKSDAAQLERIGLLVECVKAKLGEQPEPKPPVDFPPVEQLPTVAEFPIPGTYYRIQAGDQLLGKPVDGGVTSRAYNTQGGTPANYQASKLINDHPYNARFREFFEKEANLYPTGRISFNPKFGPFSKQWADPVNGAEGQGKEYAVIYIPEKA